MPVQQTSASEPALRLLPGSPHASPFPMESSGAAGAIARAEFSVQLQRERKRFGSVASPRLPRDPPEFDGIRDSSLAEKPNGPRP